MSSAVLDLQRDAMESNLDLTDLLRKAYVIAKKLKIAEFEEWAESELDGYGEKDIPSYRRVRGHLKYYNPFYGYQDYLIGNSDISEVLSNRSLSNPIAELEDLYNKSGGKPLLMPISTETRLLFIQQFNAEESPEHLFISPSQFKSIFEAVRKIILDWALKLEEDDILGEDLRFTQEEKEIAEEKSSKYTTIIKDSIVQVGEKNIQNVNKINTEEVGKLLSLIHDSLEELKLDIKKKEDLDKELTSIKSQLDTANPDEGTIKKSIRSIKKILEGCASNLIASGILYEISKIPIS